MKEFIKEVLEWSVIADLLANGDESAVTEVTKHSESQELKIKTLETKLRNNKKVISNVIEQLEWAQMTLREKLQFGLPEEHAIKRREARSRGVFLSEIPRLKELIK